MKVEANPSMRFMSSRDLYLDLIEQLSKDKSPEANKAISELTQIKSPSKASIEDVAVKLNEIIKALKA